MINNNTEAEIDLFKLTIKSFKFLYKRKYFMLICIVASLLAAFINIKLQPTKYQSTYKKSIVLYSPVTSKETFVDILKGLCLQYQSENLVDESSKKDLHLSPRLLNEIKKITIVPITNESKSDLTKITIELINKNHFDSIVNGVIFYCSKKPLF